MCPIEKGALGGRRNAVCVSDPRCARRGGTAGAGRGVGVVGVGVGVGVGGRGRVGGELTELGTELDLDARDAAQVREGVAERQRAERAQGAWSGSSEGRGQGRGQGWG